MKKKAEEFDLTPLRDSLPIGTIDRDFAVLDDVSQVPFFEYPTRIEEAVSLICMRGTVEASVNLKRYVFGASQIVIILPEQILQYHHISEDFSGHFVVMSKRFIDLLQMDIPDTVSLFLYLRENPAMILSPAELELCLDYYSMLDKTVKMGDNPNRKETVKYLSLALFYSANTIFHRHKVLQKGQRSRKEIIFESFYKLVQSYHMGHRSVEFYADKLSLTPKYLTTVVRETSGKTAHDWILEYVILSAKALLKSTNMTIQEISDRLNFPSQSFFGKYFKQQTWMSPVEYRKKG
jgi:AraC-type DNA-binding domain-containing proteins